MKMSIKPMILMFVCMTFLMSCNNEELFIEPTTEVVEEPAKPEEETPDEGEETPEDTDTPITDSTTPCDFNLNNVQPGETVVINCVMDLDGATVTIPSNVTLAYEGGDIINGTLNFSGNGIISGELLNKTLNLTGSTPTLKETTFEFVTSKWGIVEGRVSSEVALSNRDILEDLMLMVKDMEGNTFKIDALDAYFEVSLVTSGTSNQNFYPSVEAINVPGDFNLVMSPNTHLRVQPNGNEKYALMAVREVGNVTITGGNLYGDRDEHDYSSGGTHEWGHVLDLIAAVNTTVTGVTMKNGSGDGLKVHSLRFTFQPDYAPSHNVLVQNCTFDSNRRNNISITDGYNITIESNLILNAGIDTGKSSGTDPRFGLDVEPVRGSDDNGGYIYYEKAEHIYIRNNTERGSAKGAFTVHIGSHVTIEGNHTENVIGYTYANGTKIRNNTITATANSNTTTAISAGTSSTTSTSVYDNEISGNTITGFGVGINVKNKTTDVFDNILNNNITGIFPNNLTDSKIYNNKISTDRDSGKGIFLFNTELNNVIIEGNEVYGSQNAVKVTSVNTSPESVNNTVVFKNNSLNSPRYSQMSKANGIRFEGNNFNHGFEVYDSNKIDFTSNEIVTSSHDGIYLRNTNTNIKITDNVIDVASNRQCVRIDPTTSTSSVVSTNNDCL